MTSYSQATAVSLRAGLRFGGETEPRIQLGERQTHAGRLGLG